MNREELIWAQFKNEFPNENQKYKLAYVKILVNNALYAITTEIRAKCGVHYETIQEDDLVKKCAIDEIHPCNKSLFD